MNANLVDAIQLVKSFFQKANYDHEKDRLRGKARQSVSSHNHFVFRVVVIESAVKDIIYWRGNCLTYFQNEIIQH